MTPLTIAQQLIQFTRATKETPWTFLERVGRGEVKDTRRNQQLVAQAQALSRVRFYDADADQSSMVDTSTKEKAR